MMGPEQRVAVTMNPLSKWFYRQQPRPEARLRLFCFPYAGGGAALFRNWQASVGNDVEVIAIRTPGRESRFGEPAISSLSVLVEQLYQQLLPLLDKPFAFFGHSNGALTCFELARLLHSRGQPLPQRLILSAKRPPHIGDPKSAEGRATSQLPDAEFIAELQQLEGTPPEVLQNRDLMELFLPTLRADFALSDQHQFVPGSLLPCPATIFYGHRDSISLAHLQAWQELLAPAISLRVFSGGHFFIDEQRPELLAAVASELQTTLNALPPARVAPPSLAQFYRMPL